MNAERKPIEEQLARAADDWRITFDSIQDLVMILDSEFRIERVNAAVARFFGKPPESIVGSRCHTLMHGTDSSIAGCPVRKVFQTGRHGAAEVFHEPTNAWLLVSADPITDANGNVVKVVHTVRDITERKRAEEERVSHLKFLESMDRINRAMQGTNDLDRVITNVLDAMLSIFDSDRAFLDYPCDPDAASFEVVMERSRPEYPRATGVISMPPDTARNFRLYLESSGPVTLGPGCDYPLEISHYGQKSQVVIALYPKTGKPWLLGMHQCSYARAWTREDKKLLSEIARRMTDALTSLLTHRDLHESEERYRVTLRTAMDGFFRTDMQGKILEVNETFCAMTGYSEQELLAMNIVDISMRNIEKIAADIKSATELGPQRFESIHRRKDGSLFDVEIGAQHQPIAGGRIVAFARDITERKRAEKELRKQADLLNLTHDTVFVTDPEGVIKYWNRGAEEAYGWSAEQAMGKVVHELLKTVFPTSFEKIKALVMEKDRWEGELLHTRKDGTRIVAASRWALKRDEQGAPVAIMETNNDITERKRAEEALRQSETYLAEAQRLSRTGCWALDTTTGEVYSSEENSRIYGFDPKEGPPTWQAALARIHPEDRDGVRGCIEKSLREKIATSNEHRIVLPDGTVKYIHATRRPMLNDAGEVVKLVGVLTDITERKRAEEALRESEHKYRELVENANSIILRWNSRGEITFLNEFGQKFFGYNESEILGRNMVGAITPEIESTGRDLRSLIAGICENPTAFKQSVNENMLRDGSRVWIAWTNKAAFDAEGKPTGVLSIGSDITERKRAEEALRRSEAYLAEAQRLTHTGSFAYRPGGDVLYASEETIRIWGFDRQQEIPNHEVVRQRIHPDDLARVRARSEASVRAKTDWDDEFRIVLPDGEVKHIRGIHHPVFSASGELIEVVGTSMDITEHKRTEQTLRRLNRELLAIGDCNQALLRVTDEQNLLDAICRIICEEAGYRMAWVGYAENDEARSVRPAAWAGVEEGYLATANITWADTERGRGPAGIAIRSGQSCYIQDYATDPRFAPWGKSALQRGYRSGIVLPLKDEHAKVFGCLCIYCAERNAFTSEEIRLLEQLGADLAFGIVTLRSRAARKRAEQEVAILSFALDKIGESAFLIDETGHFQYVNEECCRFLGYTRAELLDLGVSNIDPKFPAERWPDQWRDLKEKRSMSFESRHRTKDGRTFPVEVSANYFEYEGQAYNIALVRNITQRKAAEDALRLSEAYLAESQRLTHTGSWALDVASDTYIYASEECFRIYGFDPEGEPVSQKTVLRLIHPEDRNRLSANHEKSLREKVDTSDEYRLVLPHGTVKHLQSIRHPVLNDAGDIVQLVGTTVDITDRKLAEEELQNLLANLESRVEKRTRELSEANQSLQAANKELDSFTYSVAHDLRAPLRAIDGFSLMVLKDYADTLDEDGRRKLKVIRSNTQQMGRLIDDLLTFSRVGRKEMANVRLDMEAIVRSAWRELTQLTPERRLELSVRRLPSGMGDQALIKAVVTNLLSNAIKFTKYRENAIVEVGAYFEKGTEIYYIKDNGVGFNMQYYDKLFGVFQRLHSAEEFEGTGVGLAIVERIINRHGGRVWAEGKEGEGAAFYFTLPERGDR